MAIRERVKKIFGRNSSSKDPEGKAAEKEEKKKKKGKKQDEQWEDWPEHIYKPHEMPRPKYRRVPDPDHKAHLQSYNWDSNTPPDDDPPRQKSHASLYSPMGSRIPSRMNSLVSRRAKSRGPSRAGSVLQEGAEGEGEESEAGNVGLSRYHSNTSTPSRSDTKSKRNSALRPGTSTVADHPPVVEDDSAEATPLAGPSTFAGPDQRRAAVDEDAALDGEGQGSELTQEVTVTEASEVLRRERASTVKHDQPFSQDELSRALSTLTVKAEPNAVAAAS